jgi:phage terminase large subunit
MICAFLLVAAMAVSAPAPTKGRTIDFPVARAYVPLLQPARYKGAFGGRGSGKSHEFAKNLLKRCIEKPGTRAVCVREVQRSLEQSVKRLLTDKISEFGISDQFQIAKTEIATPGNGIIVFQGMQDHTSESIKSLEGFHVAWIEEAQSVSERSLTLLRPTIREKGSEIWASWNPRNATDPVDQLLRGANKQTDAIVVEANYRDNPWFPEVLRKEMEWDRAHDVEKYKHVWLGAYEVRSEAQVFRNWAIEEFDTPADAVHYLGADWGFSVDPSVLIRCHVNGRTLFVDYEAYRIGVEIDHLGQLFDTVPGARDWPIVADSARPETISYLNRNGFPKMESAQKGKDSVKEGVAFLQNYDIRVHPRCIHTIDELGAYSFKVDKLSGMVTPHLQDNDNHVIDSLRYAVERLRKVVEVREATWGR